MECLGPSPKDFLQTSKTCFYVIFSFLNIPSEFYSGPPENIVVSLKLIALCLQYERSLSKKKSQGLIWLSLHMQSIQRAVQQLKYLKYYTNLNFYLSICTC